MGLISALGLKISEEKMHSVLATIRGDLIIKFPMFKRLSSPWYKNNSSSVCNTMYCMKKVKDEKLWLDEQPGWAVELFTDHQELMVRHGDCAKHSRRRSRWPAFHVLPFRIRLVLNLLLFLLPTFYFLAFKPADAEYRINISTVITHFLTMCFVFIFWHIHQHLSLWNITVSPLFVLNHQPDWSSKP